MSENKLEKLFSEILETWLALKILCEDEELTTAQRNGARFAAEIFDELLASCGFLQDTSDFFLEKQQIKFDSLKGELPT